jgi:arginine/lysine/ornithine decarboxylase
MGRPVGMPRRQDLAAEVVMTPAEAFFARAEEIPLDRATGRIAAEMISPYPPGIPAVLPGERITKTHVAFLRAELQAGVFVMDAWIANKGVFRVVA